ncbi:hypothetical protein ACIQ8D_19420 [Streptomyces sp. NPDC096094]|uniref:hypothetical protein n=1 Tax=Streptomyces sp. NPDC096094 TaxID=3366073 RepID=UPI0038205D39
MPWDRSTGPCAAAARGWAATPRACGRAGSPAAGRVRRPAHWLSGVIGAGLGFSGVTNTCGLTAVPARPPHDRPTADAVPSEETPTRLESREP